ncbi:MAG: hypothetical protein FGO69_06425 [Methanobacterium sp.]|nr:MAG: hypothetical protein FGO69_06425 [Methanobacterium sp.]
MKKYYLLFGVLVTMVITAAYFGWVDSSKSFKFSDGLASDGSISFNYPEIWRIWKIIHHHPS